MDYDHSGCGYGGRRSDYDRDRGRNRDYDRDRYRNHDRGGRRRGDRCDHEDFNLNHKDTFCMNRNVVEKR